MLQLGAVKGLKGFVTRLNALGPTGPAFAEAVLGLQEGRLAGGYSIALLIEPLRPNHVMFGGGTQYSGGRLGLPASTPEADRQRKLVHEDWRERYGDAALAKMAEFFAKDGDNLTTFRRVVKIVAAAPQMTDNPAAEYPPGQSAPQYILTERHRFFIAAEINPQQIARTAAGWGVPLAPDVPSRTKKLLYDYLRDLKLPKLA